MRVLLAKTAGFCMGVRRAVEMVLDATNRSSGPVWTFGPLIHNPQVMDVLLEKGVGILDHVPTEGKGTVLIRAHGVTPEAKEALRGAGFHVLDATCPRVVKVQSIVRKHAEKGYTPIIVGDRDHPEVIGILGHTLGKGHVVNTAEQVHALPDLGSVVAVAQTTQDVRLFHTLSAKIRERFPRARVFNTICDSTAKRQNETRELARSVDAVVVVGGRNSGNTRRLVQIAEAEQVPTFHVETESEIDFVALEPYRVVGITAGASTPNWIIRRVVRTLESHCPAGRKSRGRPVYTLQHALLLTNLYVALGAGGLCHACTLLQGLTPSFSMTMMAVLYVLSMHILNNFIGHNAIRYNDPDRAVFYDRHRKLLMTMAVLAGLAGLATGFAAGAVPFSILLAMVIMGLLYNVKVVPDRWKLVGKYQRMRDVPGSKTLLIALAWGVVSAVLPALTLTHTVAPGGVPVFLWATGIVFVRTAFFDVLDVQGDRIVGQETIATVLGERRTLRLLKGVLLLLAVVCVVMPHGSLPGLNLLLLACVLLPGVVIVCQENGYLPPGYRLEFVVETNFILAGCLAALRHLV